MKTMKLSILVAVIAVITVILSLSVVAVSAEDITGLSFVKEKLYQARSSLEKMPQTYEATVYIPTTAAENKRVGIIYGNWGDADNYKANSVNFEISSQYRPRMYFVNAAGKAYDLTFSGVNLTPGKTEHFAIVLDSANKKAMCYLNGELAETVDFEYAIDYAVTKPCVLGGNIRNNNSSYFLGVVESLAIYSDVRTADEIKSDMTAPGNDDLVVYHDLSSYKPGDQPSMIEDLSPCGHDVYLRPYYTNEEITGLSFVKEKLYRANSALEKMPQTYEATVHIPITASSTKRVGVIYGNWGDADSYKANSVNFEITAQYSPRMYLVNAAGKAYDLTFSGVSLTPGKKEHFAIVLDSANKKAMCYLNGELAETVDFEYAIDYAITKPCVLGGNIRYNNSTYFLGVVESLAIYSDVRTADEIKSDMTAPGSDGLMVHHDLSSYKAGDQPSMIEDLSPYGHDVYLQPYYTQDGNWFTDKEPVTDYAYSFAIIGDTQYLLEKHPEEFPKLYDWLVDNAEEKNIKFVFGLGDITNSDTIAEWNLAKEHITKLDGVIPYSLIRGNHDSMRNFNLTFTYEEYAHTFDGSYNNRMENTYQEIIVGDVKYLLLCLDFGASDDVLEWACEVVEAYPDHNVIVTTHAYLYHDGTLTEEGDGWYPIRCGAPNNADAMWDQFIKKYDNIVMVLSGHDPWEQVVMNKMTGDNGNTVTSFLIDAQEIDRSDRPTGMVCMMYFSEDGKNVQLEYYSTVQEKFFFRTNQFNFTLDTVERTAPKTSVTGTVEDGADVTVELVSDGEVVYTAQASNENKFEINAVAQGTYDLVVRKPGYLPNIIKNVYVSGNAMIANKIEFNIAGNINGDGYIDATDVSMLVSDLGKEDSIAAYATSDINKDTYRDAIDVAILGFNLHKPAPQSEYVNTVISAIAPGEFDGEEVLQLHNCDSQTGSWGAGMSLATDNAPEGTGYLTATHATLPVICAKFNAVDLSAYKPTGYLSLKVYIDDVTKISTYMGIDLWDTANDPQKTAAWRWVEPALLKNGWNELKLYFNECTMDGLDYTKATMLRVYVENPDSTSDITIGVDDIKIVYEE